VWNADGLSSSMCRLRDLKNKSLIKWAKDGSLYIHEQLQHMGQNIAMGVPMNKFIWKPNMSLRKNHV
jgi:hypothetical protein